MIPKSFVFSLLVCVSLSVFSFSQEKSDSLFQKHSVKLDLVPLYYDLFDSRMQIRLGAEYERYLQKRSSVSCYLDVGLYDKYDFIKYYDFFSQSQGMYSIQQKVSIIGFHLIPAYNYYFYTFKKRPNRKLISGIVMDLSYYHKKTAVYNTLTTVRSDDRYDQARFGMGVSFGFKNSYRKHFFYELKTSLVTGVYTYISKADRNPIKSLDAQWTNPDYNLWWISNIKMGYVF